MAFFLFHSLLLHVFLFFWLFLFCFVFTCKSKCRQSSVESQANLLFGRQGKELVMIFYFFCMLLQTYHHQPSDNSRVFFIWFFAHDFLQSPLSPFKMFFPLLHLLLCSFDSRQERSTGLGNYIRWFFFTEVVHLRVEMTEIKRGGRLLQLAVTVALLSLCAEAKDAAEVADTEITELATKQTDTRASRAKRRGGTDVLRG